MRVAVFGGSFNPPHLGHQVACLLLLEACEIDEVWLIPTYRHYFGKELLPFETRVALCKELVIPFGKRVKVVSVEKDLGEANPDSTSRMFDTLAELKRRQPTYQFYLVIGADILMETMRWHRWDEIVGMAPPIIFKRHGYEGGTLPAPPDVSSSEIRDLLRQGKSIASLVPNSIQKQIERQELYR